MFEHASDQVVRASILLYFSSIKLLYYSTWEIYSSSLFPTNFGGSSGIKSRVCDASKKTVKGSKTVSRCSRRCVRWRNQASVR